MLCVDAAEATSSIPVNNANVFMILSVFRNNGPNLLRGGIMVRMDLTNGDLSLGMDGSLQDGRLKLCLLVFGELCHHALGE